jgi:hypothetical protein
MINRKKTFWKPNVGTFIAHMWFLMILKFIL